MTESLMQQIQEAMNGGKMRAMRAKKAVKAVRKPTAGVVRKPAAAKPKRRVVPRMPKKFMGGFFAAFNNIVAGADGADGADKKKAMAAMPPAGTTMPQLSHFYIKGIQNLVHCLHYHLSVSV